MRTPQDLPNTNAPDTNYAHGKLRDDSVPGDKTGTPIRADWQSDLFYGLLEVMDRAGIAPNHLPETSISSQFADAVDKRASTTVEGLSERLPVYVATTANITLSGLQTIDGIAVVASQRVLVKNQSTASQNGIYSASSSTWNRSADSDTVNNMAGAFVTVQAGTANGGKGFATRFKITDTLGTTAMNWYEVANTSESQTFSNKTLSSPTLSGTLLGSNLGEHTMCEVATTANVDLTTGTLLTIDGVVTTADMRVLVKHQTTTSQNGIYLAKTGAWVRATDADTNGEVGGMFLAIKRGTINGGKFYETNFKTTDTLGTSAMDWFEVVDTGSVQTLSNKTLASPAFTGNPTAPTPALNVNNTSVATTAFVKAVSPYSPAGTDRRARGITADTNLNLDICTESGVYDISFSTPASALAGNAPDPTTGAWYYIETLRHSNWTTTNRWATQRATSLNPGGASRKNSMWTRIQMGGTTDGASWSPWEKIQSTLWSSAVTYEVNDPVFRNGEPYKSLVANNTNNDPMTSPGSWKLVGGGSGGGDVDNIFPDPSGSKGNTDWTNLTNATVTTVANGQTGFPTELRVLFSGTGQADRVITWPSALVGEMELRFEGFLVAGTPTISIIQGGVSLPLSVGLPTATGKFQYVGRAYVGTGDLTLRVSGTSGADLRMTSIYLGRRQVVYGAAVSNWTPYTPTFQGFGTPTAVDFEYRRVGESMEIKGKFTCGTTTAVEAQIGLPSGFSSRSDVPTIELVGMIGVSVITPTMFGILVEPSKSYVCMGLQSAGGAMLTKQVGSALSASHVVSFFASVPISQWTGAGTVQLAEQGGDQWYGNSEAVVNTNGGTGKTTKGGWTPILANTVATYYDILLDRPLLRDEVPKIVLRSKIDGNTIPAEIAGLPSLNINNFTSQYVDINTGSNSRRSPTRIEKVVSGQVRVSFASNLVGVDSSSLVSRTWASITGASDGYDAWALVIEKAGGARQETPMVVVSARRTTTQALTANVTNIVFDVEVTDTHGAWDGTTFVAPVSGWYSVDVMELQASGATRLFAYINTVANKRLAYYWGSASFNSGSRKIYLTAGQSLTFRCDGNITLSAGLEIDITRFGA